MNKISNSPTFCPAPWNGLVLEQSGMTRVCSFSYNPIGNFKKNNINDILSGKEIKEIKESIRQGRWDEGCRLCKNSEKTLGRSERLQKIKFLDNTVRDQIDNDFDIRILNDLSINWTNLCNLSCIYCNPVNSTSWGNKLGLPINLERTDEDVVINYLIENANKIRLLLIGGGEPLLQKYLVRLFPHISSETYVIITTNLSLKLDNNSIFNNIISNPNLNVKWMISFDGIENKFEYVRNDANWEIFKSNIDILKKYNQKIEAHPAYSLYCAFDLKEYYEFCISYELPILWSEVTTPVEIDVRRMPPQLKKLAIAEIDYVLDKYQGRTDLALEILANYRNMFTSDIDVDINSAIQILDFHKKIEDQLGKTITYADVWPRINQLLIELTEN